MGGISFLLWIRASGGDANYWRKPEMRKKIVFILFFTSIHVLATIILLQRLYNPSTDPGLVEWLCRAIGFVLTLPFLLPLLRIDPDGEFLPMWSPYLSLVLDGFVWGLVILLFSAVIKRYRGAKEVFKKSGTVHPHASADAP